VLQNRIDFMKLKLSQLLRPLNSRNEIEISQ